MAIAEARPTTNELTGPEAGHLTGTDQSAIDATTSVGESSKGELDRQRELQGAAPAPELDDKASAKAPDVEQTLNNVRHGRELMSSASGDINQGTAVERAKNDLNTWLEKDGVKDWLKQNGYSDEKLAGSDFETAMEERTRAFQRWFKEQHPEFWWASREDGIIGPRTMAQLDMMMERPTVTFEELMLAIQRCDYPTGYGGYAGSSFDRSVLPKLSGDFEQRVEQICQSLPGKPKKEWLLAVMHFETGGTFSPSIRNKAGSGATGLIQFMRSTARDMFGNRPEFAGLSGEQILNEMAQMSQVEQLEYVQEYLHRQAGGTPITSVEDMYMLVLYPAAAGRTDNYTLFSGGKAYAQNRGLDINRDGTVTKREAARQVSGLARRYESESA